MSCSGESWDQLVAAFRPLIYKLWTGSDHFTSLDPICKILSLSVRGLGWSATVRCGMT
ncbi:hypothetical protein CASFOL_026183 [Castilleja foliolosa]|uniref:Uncharacterized protein n=1 Tax=Castilleja foliolosa TaxID=1961234 RepID=A0ABD3CIY3_9LAMI